MADSVDLRIARKALEIFGPEGSFDYAPAFDRFEELAAAFRSLGCRVEVDTIAGVLHVFAPEIPPEL